MADKKQDRAQRAMGGSHSSGKRKSKSKSGKHVREMHIRATANKKYIIRHDHHPDANGETPGQEEHGASNLQELLEHVQEHGENMSPEQPQEPAAAQPSAAV